MTPSSELEQSVAIQDQYSAVRTGRPASPRSVQRAPYNATQPQNAIQQGPGSMPTSESMSTAQSMVQMAQAMNLTIQT
eukprot:522132-Amphidinium_carterae.1